MSILREATVAQAGLTDQRVLVLDFGSQYAQLIARRVREQNVYCEIVRHDISAERLRERTPAAVILSGGPSSVYETNSPKCDPGVFDLGVPVLGICYGMQLISESLGGQVRHAAAREYGRTRLQIGDMSDLFTGFPNEIDVWMSHGDQVSSTSDDFFSLGQTPTCPVAAIRFR